MTTGHDLTNNNFYTFDDPLGFASPLSLSAWDNGDNTNNNNHNDDSDDDSFDDAENDDLDGDWSDNNDSSHERNCLWQRDAGLVSNKPIAPLLQSPPSTSSAATTPFACAAAATAAASSAAAPTTCCSGSTRRVHFSPQEPEICCYEQADRESYSILFYSAHELQKIMDAFAQEKDGSM